MGSRSLVLRASEIHNNKSYVLIIKCCDTDFYFFYSISANILYSVTFFFDLFIGHFIILFYSILIFVGTFTFFMENFVEAFLTKAMFISIHHDSLVSGSFPI